MARHGSGLGWIGLGGQESAASRGVLLLLVGNGAPRMGTGERDRLSSSSHLFSAMGSSHFRTAMVLRWSETLCWERERERAAHLLKTTVRSGTKKGKKEKKKRTQPSLEIGLAKRREGRGRR